jgi:hypothetical protein
MIIEIAISYQCHLEQIACSNTFFYASKNKERIKGCKRSKAEVIAV